MSTWTYYARKKKSEAMKAMWEKKKNGKEKPMDKLVDRIVDEVVDKVVDRLISE